MTDELFISGERVDLPEGASIGLDYELTDIGELENRKGNKSSSIKIPFTANNLRLFGYSSIPESSSTLPYTSLTCKYKKYGLQIINDGRIIIDEIEQDGFSCNIYFGNFDFMTQIKEAKLTDLDFDSLEEDWTSGNIIAKIDATTGLTYPVMDWHADSPNAKINTTDSAIAIDSLYPALFEKTIFDKIISDCGFTYTMPTSVVGFENKVVPLVDKLSNAALMDAFEVYYSSDIERVITSETITFEDLITDFYGLMSGGQTYVIPVDGLYTALFDFNYTLIDNGAGGPVSVNFIITHYDSLGVKKGEYRFVQATVISEERSIFYTAKFVKGDKIECDAVATTIASELTFHSGYFKTLNIDCKYTGFGYLYPISKNLPDINQKDFVKNIMQRYGLFVVQSETLLTFYKLDDVLANKDKAISLDSVVVTDKRLFENKRFAPDGFSQRNYWKYKDDETVEGSFSGYLTCNNTNIDAEKTVYTSPFAACNDDIMCNGLQMAHVKRLVSNVWTNKMQPKVLSTWQCTNTLGVSGSTVTLFNVAVFDDNVNTDSLDFADVLTTNYSILTQILTDPVEIRVKVDWGVLDFINIDPTIPYFLWNEFYLLKKVNNFRRDELTELELIRI